MHANQKSVLVEELLDQLQKADTNYEADKGAMSDSFKRSAVMWGIGRHLYDLPSVWVKCETKNGRFSRFTQDPWQVVQSKQSDFS